MATPFQPTPIVETTERSTNPFTPALEEPEDVPVTPVLEPEEDWRALLNREQQEQIQRELHRQRMASLQADQSTYDSPIAVDLKSMEAIAVENAQIENRGSTVTRPGSVIDLYAAALQAGIAGQEADAMGRRQRRAFSIGTSKTSDLPNRVVTDPQRD
ncbi:MAG TPA: hypothetical protein VGM83_14765 [Devosiaceae bacterium]